jgi:predicted nucleic acid-binding protein
VSVFVDTSALYALLVRNEEGHSAVRRALDKVLESARTLHTTSYVLVETVALLQHRIGLDSVRDLDEHISPLLSIEWVSAALHEKGMRRLAREDRRGLSFVDCVSLEFMQAHGLRDALALDRHFAAAGFRLLPAPRG